MLNFSVGPVMMDNEILELGSKQIPYFRTPEFSNLMFENENLLKKFTKASDTSKVLSLTGSGTCAMEAAVINLFSANDKVLVVNGGTFGERFKQICDIHRIEADEIKLNYFEDITLKHLEPFENKKYDGFLLNIHETSTGVLYNIDIISEFCKRNNILLVVDAISSFLADTYNMKKYGICTTILSSQKAIALPPGMSFIIIDEIAQERILKSKVQSLYFKLSDYIINGERGQTPYTPAVGILLQLNKKLQQIDAIGIDKVIESVKIQAQDFRNRITDLPLKISSTTLSNAITPLEPVGKLNAFEIFTYLKDKYDIFVVPNGGELSKKIFRVGHIGSLSISDNTYLLDKFHKMNSDNIL